MKDKIIILGLAGTGKTTLAKTLVEKSEYLYLSDWEILKNKKLKLETEIQKHLNSTSKLVLDLDLRNFEDFAIFEASENKAVIYLLFDSSLNAETLRKKFQEKDENITLETIKQYLEISKKYKCFCKKHKLEYAEINQDKHEVLINVLNKLKI